MLEELLPVGARLAAADEALLQVDPARGFSKSSRVKTGVSNSHLLHTVAKGLNIARTAEA